MPFFLLAMLLMPLVEIGVLIAVGAEIGVLWTLALVVLASVVGIAVIRRQSMATFRTARAEAQAGRVPDRALVHGAMIVAAGFLLILPGFVTDAIGLLLLLPPVRDLLWQRLKSRVVVVGGGAPRGYRPADPVHRTPGVLDLNEAEFERRDGDPQSPWRAEIEDEKADRGPKRGDGL